ncbi:FecR family protein [Aquimarina sp. 2304DJ70-9]|uniref:FecR family protein n=1 Tax=Aquimarina penaris TaxID=3231044 RepID=UPI003462883B
MENLGGKKEELLARWISNELSMDEREAFENSKEFEIYNVIFGATEQIEIEPYNKETAFESIQRNVNKDIKDTSIVSKWMYIAAASIVLLLGYFYFSFQKESFESNYGEQLELGLPDGSEVILNSKAQVSYRKRNWDENRMLNLDGEAYFKVNPGSTFKIILDEGVVTVIGTEFTVNSNTKILEVICFKGKVKIESNKKSKILNSGEATRVINSVFENWTLSSQKPLWINGESNFNNAPLYQVIKALENQYNIKVNNQNIDDQVRFSGSFTHKNMEIALQTVFKSAKIKYTLKNKNMIDLEYDN